MIARCRVRTTRIHLAVTSPLERFRARTYATKEPETLDWLDQYLCNGDVLYDIGANIGLYSLYAALSRPHCTVFAFEPEAMNYARLNQNILLNRLSSRITACCLALTANFCFSQFYLHPQDYTRMTRGRYTAGASLHRFGTTVDYLSRPFTAFHVQGMVGVSLDTLWHQWHCPFPNHLKIDVDGDEPAVLQGASHTLADPRLHSILVEITGDPTATLASLSRYGFDHMPDFAIRSRHQNRRTPYPECVNHVVVRTRSSSFSLS